MKKIGFTLIELLAVIVILSILVAFAIPITISIYKDYKMDAFSVEAKNMVEAAQEGFATTSLQTINVQDTTITFNNGVESKIGNIDFQTSGRKIKDGEIIINKNGTVEFTIHDGTYCASKDVGSDNITVEEKPLEECIIIPPGPTDETCFTFDDVSGKITDYDYTNENCPSDIIIPDTINDIPVTTIGNQAFFNNNITSVVFGNNVTTIGMEAFERNQITSLNITENLTDLGAYSFYSNLITSLVIPDNITRIRVYAFTNNLINNLVISDSVTSIEGGAFHSNYLTSVDIPTSVTSLGGGAFNNNQLPEEDAFIYKRNSDGTKDTTTLISYAGAERDNINIPSNITKFDSQAFYGLNLTSFTIPSNITYIGSSTFANNDFTSINIPAGVTYIGGSAFESNNLTSITIPNGIINIYSYAFRNNNLVSVTIPSSVTYIGNYAFASNKLIDITIPTNVTQIGDYAFSSNHLESIAIPNSVTSIGSNAFRSNYILQGDATIDNSSSNVTIGTDAFIYNGADRQTTIIPVFLR